jgi:hypothetical protein
VDDPPERSSSRRLDRDGTAESFGEFDCLLFRACRPQFAAYQQDWLLFAFQELYGSRNGGTQRLRVARLLAKDCTDRAGCVTRSRCDVACDVNISRLFLAQRAADCMIDLVRRVVGGGD